MKKNETPQLDSDWWHKGKPMLLRDKSLDVALEQYEKMAKAYDRAPGLDTHLARRNALEDVRAAAASVLAVCERSKLGAYAETIAVLKKFPRFLDDKFDDFEEQYEQLVRIETTAFERRVDALAERMQKIEDAGAVVFSAALQKHTEGAHLSDVAIHTLDALYTALRALQQGGHPGTKLGDFADDAQVRQLRGELANSHVQLKRVIGEIQATSAQAHKWYGILQGAKAEAESLVADKAAAKRPELLAAVQLSLDLIKRSQRGDKDGTLDLIVDQPPNWLKFVDLQDSMTVDDLKPLVTTQAKDAIDMAAKVGSQFSQQAASVRQGTERARLALEKRKKAQGR